MLIIVGGWHEGERRAWVKTQVAKLAEAESSKSCARCPLTTEGHGVRRFGCPFLLAASRPSLDSNMNFSRIDNWEAARADVSQELFSSPPPRQDQFLVWVEQDTNTGIVVWLGFILWPKAVCLRPRSSRHTGGPDS